MPDQADQLAQVIGRPVTTVDVPPESARGLPAAARLGSAWARAGHNATLTGDVREVLGRDPVTFRDWARRHRDAFVAQETAA